MKPRTAQKFARVGFCSARVGALPPMLVRSNVMLTVDHRIEAVGKHEIFNRVVDIVSFAHILNQMVQNRLDTTFRALADPTRRGMLANLALGEKSIGQLAQPFAMTFAGASKHVRVLEEAGLVLRRREGRTHFCCLNPEPLGEADGWLRQWENFWSVRLDRLQELVETNESQST